MKNEPREIKYYSRRGPITPWGNADMREIFTDDVSFYSTPSHGGFRVSGKTLQRIPKHLQRGCAQWNGWFEEDCDWAIVAWYLTELFDAADRDHALNTIQNYLPEMCKELGLKERVRIRV
jgi:hypothetical protein